METELKLKLDPSDLRRVARLPCVRRCSQGRGERRLLRSVYFDTEDFALLRKRMTIRTSRISSTPKTRATCATST
jgi:inorganic triphosphatase YgiF